MSRARIEIDREARNKAQSPELDECKADFLYRYNRAYFHHSKNCVHQRHSRSDAYRKFIPSDKSRYRADVSRENVKMNKCLEFRKLYNSHRDEERRFDPRETFSKHGFDEGEIRPREARGRRRHRGRRSGESNGASAATARYMSRHARKRSSRSFCEQSSNRAQAKQSIVKC